MRTSLGIAAGVIIATVLVGLPGCPHDRYVVEMWPRGRQLERTVVVTHVNGNTTQPGKPNILRRSRDLFASSIPDQLDGSRGRYACYAGEFGGAYFYTERIRGDDDQASAVDAQFKAVDRLVELVLGWTKREYGRFAEYPKLAAFIDRDLRRDLKNVGLIALLGDAAHRTAIVVGTTPAGVPTTEPEKGLFTSSAVARAAQYAVERDYLRPGDLGRLFRAAKDGRGEISIRFVRELLVRKAGLTDKAFLDALCQALADFEKTGESFASFARGTAVYRAALADWQARPDRPQTQPEVQEVLLAPAFQTATNLIDLGTPDTFSITLHVTGQAIQTNGWWDEDAGTIRWWFSFPKARLGVPAVCYAVWAAPDDAAQKARFGRVLLDGDKLVEYCLWRNGLSPEEATEWAVILARLKPGIDPAAALEGARFAGQDKDPHGAALIRNAASRAEK